MPPAGKKPIHVSGLPERVVVGANGAYWRDYGDYYSMCPVSTDNDPVEPVAVYVRQVEYIDPTDKTRGEIFDALRWSLISKGVFIDEVDFRDYYSMCPVSTDK